MKVQIMRRVLLAAALGLAGMTAGCAGFWSGVGYQEGPARLTEADKELEYKALAHAMETRHLGARESWSNPATGDSGTIIVTEVNMHSFPRHGRDYVLPSGQYTEETHIGDFSKTSHGRGVVLLPEGVWYRYQ